MLTSVDHLPGLGKSEHMWLPHELHVYTESNQQAKPKFRYLKRDYIIMNSELLKVNWPLMDDMNVRKHGISSVRSLEWP